MNAFELLDRQLNTGVWDWVPNLSHHRAVFCQRRVPPPRGASARPIPFGFIRQPDWPHRVALHFNELQDLLMEIGLMAVLNVKSDLGFITDGKYYHLDTELKVCDPMNQIYLTVFTKS